MQNFEKKITKIFQIDFFMFTKFSGRYEFDVRLRLHYKWQEKLVAQHRVNGITSYDSYRDSTLRSVAQRYFKVRHEHKDKHTSGSYANTS